MTSLENVQPNNRFLVPWDHTGKPPFNQLADECIKKNEGNILYVEEAAVSMYGTQWYCVSVWLKDEEEKEEDSQ